ncbi:helix-turn-helix domain-containing protein [Butyricicoccus pullicaecorum]|nr:helix-turn-helix domain-containing protein [Butyricicoccus pullicaecorum]
MSMNRLLSVKEVAVLLQTSRVQVRRMIQSGELAALKVGREYRIPLAVLQEFIRAALA